MKLIILLSLLTVSSVDGFFNISQVRPRHFDEIHGKSPRKITPQIEGRITNGQAAKVKQFPYQAGLLLHFSDGAFWCGGTLLSVRWIVTAAHCTLGVSSIEVILGGIRSTPNGDAGEVVIFVNASSSNIFVHKGYDELSFENDISLIRLPEAITLSEYIQPASLPKFDGTAPLYTGKIGIASGWGRVSDTSSSISSTLQWADVPVISNAACAVYYGRQPFSVLCIGTKETKKSTCNGDSGGPLVLQGTNTLIGITSFGVTYGCEVEWPAGFSRVTSFLGWIKEISGLSP